MIQQANEIFAKGDGKYSFQGAVIQSGALHNIQILIELEDYNETLFIDPVDYVYCARVRMKNYLIIKLNKANLLQNTNDDLVENIRRKGVKLSIHKYSDIRYYYMFRNVMYCNRKYKKHDLMFCEINKYTISRLCKTVGYEKIKQIKAIFCGLIDYLLGKISVVTMMQVIYTSILNCS